MSTQKQSILTIAEKYLTDTDRKGKYFTTITSQFARVIVSTVAAFLVFPLAAFDSVSGVSLLPFWAWTLVSIVLGVYIGWNEPKLNIPANHVGIITFLGRRYPVYLKEGDYYWIGRRFFVDVTSQPLPGAKNVQAGDGEEQGRIFIGKRVLQIWNDRKEKSIKVSLPARAGSTVVVNLTITVRTIDPMQWAIADDPILQIAEQARAGLRKAVTFFRDTDVSGAKSAVTSLVAGKRVITAFTAKTTSSYLFGSMIQNKSGIPMYEVIDAKPIADDPAIQRQLDNLDEMMVALKMEEFGKQAIAMGKPEMVKAASEEGKGLIVVVLNIQESVDVVLGRVGSTLDNIILSDAQLSQVVREASERAAAEGAQRESQITSAETQAEVIKRLAEARRGVQTDDLDRLIAATQDGNDGIKIIHVTGSPSDLVKAAVAGGQQIGGNK